MGTLYKRYKRNFTVFSRIDSHVTARHSACQAGILEIPLCQISVSEFSGRSSESNLTKNSEFQLSIKALCTTATFVSFTFPTADGGARRNFTKEGGKFFFQPYTGWKVAYFPWFNATVPNVGAIAHRWALESSRGAVVDQNEFGGAEADHRPLTKINIYPKLQKNIPKYHDFFWIS